MRGEDQSSLFASQTLRPQQLAGSGLPPRPPKHPTIGRPSCIQIGAPYRQAVDINLHININLKNSQDKLRAPIPQHQGSKDFMHSPTSGGMHILQPGIQYIPNSSLPRQCHSNSVGQRSRVVAPALVQNPKYFIPPVPTPTAVKNSQKQSSTSLTKDSQNSTQQTSFYEAKNNTVSLLQQKTVPTQQIPTEGSSPALGQVTTETASSGHGRVKTEQGPTYVSNMRLCKEEIITCVICKKKFKVSDANLHANLHRKQTNTINGIKDSQKTGAASLTPEKTEKKSLPQLPKAQTQSRESRMREVRALFQKERDTIQPNTIETLTKKVEIRRVESIPDMDLMGCEMFYPESIRIPSFRPSLLGPYLSDDCPSRIPGGPVQVPKNDAPKTQRISSNAQEHMKNSWSEKN